MKEFASIKIAFRTQFHFNGGGPHPNLCDRQVISYPITEHTLKCWEKDRSANQILFKVHKLPEGYVGLVTHMPHGLPEKLKATLPAGAKTALRDREQRVWLGVHQVLDKRLIRLP